MKDLPSRFKQNFIDLLGLVGMYMLERLSDFITIRSSQPWCSTDRLGERIFSQRPLLSVCKALLTFCWI